VKFMADGAKRRGPLMLKLDKTILTGLLLTAMGLAAPAQTKENTSSSRHIDLVNVFTGTSNSRWMQFLEQHCQWDWLR